MLVNLIGLYFEWLQRNWMDEDKPIFSTNFADYEILPMFTFAENQGHWCDFNSTMVSSRLFKNLFELELIDGFYMVFIYFWLWNPEEHFLNLAVIITTSWNMSRKTGLSTYVGSSWNPLANFGS